MKKEENGNFSFVLKGRTYELYFEGNSPKVVLEGEPQKSLTKLREYVLSEKLPIKLNRVNKEGALVLLTTNELGKEFKRFLGIGIEKNLHINRQKNNLNESALKIDLQEKLSDLKIIIEDYLSNFKNKQGLYIIKPKSTHVLKDICIKLGYEYKSEIAYIGKAELTKSSDLRIRSRQEMGWSNFEGATFVRKIGLFLGFDTKDKKNKVLNELTHLFILENFTINCVVLDSDVQNIETEYIKNYNPCLNDKKNKKQKAIYLPAFNKIKNQHYLLNCSGKKIKNQDLKDIPFKLENLAFNTLIGEERKELLDIIQQKNIELYSSDNKKKIENNLNFSRTEKAYLIYSKGKVYNAANSKNWSENETSNVYILSALFGIIKATDYIPIYDLALDYRLNNEPFFFKKYWKKNGKIDMIINQLKDENVILINLLSNNYNSVINSNHNNLVNPGIIWNDRGDSKGKWLKNQFEK